MSARLAAAFTTCQMAFGVILSPQILSSRLTRRKIAPPLMPPAVDASRRDPHIDGAFRPEWNRNGPNVLSLANQVSNHAARLADLKVFRFESNKFGPSQSASDEQRQDRPITFASEGA